MTAFCAPDCNSFGPTSPIQPLFEDSGVVSIIRAKEVPTLPNSPVRVWVGMVDVTVTLNDALAKLLGNSALQRQRSLLEGTVAEAYRLGRITRGEVTNCLGHSSWHETEKFLTLRQLVLIYDMNDLEHDLAVMDKIHRGVV